MTRNSLSHLSQDWQAACDAIQDFLEGCVALPADSIISDSRMQHGQLQALLHLLVATRRVLSTGFTMKLGASIGKWVQLVLQQQQEQPSVGISIIPALTGRHAPTEQYPHAQPLTRYGAFSLCWCLLASQAWI